MVLTNDYGGFFVLYAYWNLDFISGFVLEFRVNKPCKKEFLIGYIKALKHLILSLFRGTY